MIIYNTVNRSLIKQITAYIISATFYPELLLLKLLIYWTKDVSSKHLHNH